MNIWLKNSIKNILPLSISEQYEGALGEWKFNGEVTIYENRVNCELCENSSLFNHFTIVNTNNSNQLKVGSSCILKFDQILVFDSTGKKLVAYSDRKKYLEIVLDRHKRELSLEPLRQAWKFLPKLSGEREAIERCANLIKKDIGFSPNELIYLINKMEYLNIDFSDKYFKLNLNSYFNKIEIIQLSNEDFNKISKYLSASKRHEIDIARQMSNKKAR